MKKIILFTYILIFALNCMAQEKIAYPFQGGKDIMARFFKDSVLLTPEFKQSKATGVVIFKFTADEKGAMTKMVVYYADDSMLVPPVIEALKKSNHKWIIPDNEKFHDFIVQFAFNFKTPENQSPEFLKDVYDYNRNRKQIISKNVVLLDMATMLPTIAVNYSMKE